MSDALASSLGIVAYLALFAAVGVAFLFVNLVVGRLVRPQDPHAEKLEIYECGEPAIGSSFVQFDLRFYVVALLFIIFDVEVAFFFPWATVFGKATNLADPKLTVIQRSADNQLELTPAARGLMQELGVRNPSLPDHPPAYMAQAYNDRFTSKSVASESYLLRESARRLAIITIGDILVFFGVLMVGFLYVWKRGDLDWVRALGKERAVQREERAPVVRTESHSVLSV